MEIIKHNNLIPMLNKCLPQHLWVSARLELFNLDEYRYIDSGVVKYSTRNETGKMLSLNSLGRIITIQEDTLGVLVYQERYARIMGFCEFLQTVGGNIEEYREQIVLITGNNLWNNIML